MRKKIKIEDWKLKIDTEVLTSRHQCHFANPKSIPKKSFPNLIFSFRKMEKQHPFVSA